MPAKVTEGQIRLDRPSLVDLKARLACFGKPFSLVHGDPGLEIGLTEKAHRLVADLIATDAWMCFVSIMRLLVALNRLRRIANRHSGT